MQVALTVEWQVRTEDIIPWTGDADMVSGGWSVAVAVAVAVHWV